MKYFIDSEFIDTGTTIDLISIALVCEDGREYYAQSIEVDLVKGNNWLRENVYPHLHSCSDDALTRDISYHQHLFKGQCAYGKKGLTTCHWRTREEIRGEITRFCNQEKYGKPELYGWCSGYDFVALCQLFGTMMDLPSGWPHYMKDLQYVLDEHGIADDELPPSDGQLHHALADAKWLKHAWKFVEARVAEAEEREWDAIVSQPHTQAALRRLAQEARREDEAGETVEGGFGMEEEPS